jgi:hypothetical protein
MFKMLSIILTMVSDVLIITKFFQLVCNGNKDSIRIEVFLLRELNFEQRLWCLVDPARKLELETTILEMTIH